MRLIIVVATFGMLALLGAPPAEGQEGTYDLWLCFDACDETDRESLAYTRAELVLSAAPLNLDSVPAQQLEMLELAHPGSPTTANGCFITHVEAGRIFRPESDVFSLVAWTPKEDSKIAVEAPQEPFVYSLELDLSGDLLGAGMAGDQEVYVSGALRSPEDGIHCAKVARAVLVR
ncbi:MAG: hypothetical protein ABFS34_09555 [Gemmatimonadota bacterium]